MSQPHWKLYKPLGDIGNIYTDTTGVYAPEAEIWQEYDSDGKTRFQVYRFSLDKLFVKKGKIVNEHGHEEWFSDRLSDVASSAGTTVARLAKALAGRDIGKRFSAYYDIGGHYGFDNLDSYPLDLSELELEKRQRPSARRLHTARHGYSRPGSRRRHR